MQATSYEERRKKFERRRDRGHADPALEDAAEEGAEGQGALRNVLDTRELLRETSAALLRAEKRNKRLKAAMALEEGFRVEKDAGCVLGAGYEALQIRDAEIAAAERICSLLNDTDADAPAKAHQRGTERRRE